MENVTQQIEEMKKYITELEARVVKLEVRFPAQKKEITRENIIAHRSITDRPHKTGFRGVSCYDYFVDAEQGHKTAFQARAKGHYLGTHGTLEDAKEAVIGKCLELEIL